MDVKKAPQRRIQWRQYSFVVTIPSNIIHQLGLKEGDYVQFYVQNKTILIRTLDLTKKDLTEINKYDLALQKALEMDDEEQQKSEKQPEMSRLEKLRLK